MPHQWKICSSGFIIGLVKIGKEYPAILYKSNPIEISSDQSKHSYEVDQRGIHKPL